MQINLFKSKPIHQTPIYWVIEEDEVNELPILIKFYNQTDELIYQTNLPNLRQGVIDEGLLANLNKIKKQLLRENKQVN
jgi:hypothetical protein